MIKSTKPSCDLVEEASTTVIVAPAHPQQAAALQALEIRAASRYTASAWPQRASLPPMPVASIDEAARLGQAWILTVNAKLAAFMIAQPQDDLLYVAELDVDPAFCGARHGAKLLQHASHQAAHLSLRGISLFTFKSVPWNEPYYRRLGFIDMPAPLPPQHHRRWQQQLDGGLPLCDRVCLQRIK